MKTRDPRKAIDFAHRAAESNQEPAYVLCTKDFYWEVWHTRPPADWPHFRIQPDGALSMHYGTANTVVHNYETIDG